MNMDLSTFTKKSQEALSEAQTLAVTAGNTSVEAEHLLLSMLRQKDGLIPRILGRMEIDTNRLRRTSSANSRDCRGFPAPALNREKSIFRSG